MIIAAVVHIIYHWKWFLSMFRRITSEITQREKRINNRSRFNLLVNASVGLGFVLAAISGIYLYFVPGGRYAVPDPHIIFSRTTWDLIHTWSGIQMIAAFIVHFVIHWKWVSKVTKKIFKSLQPVFRLPRSAKNIHV
jgi:hypothetical protein